MRLDFEIVGERGGIAGQVDQSARYSKGGFEWVDWSNFESDDLDALFEERLSSGRSSSDEERFADDVWRNA